MQVFKPQKLSVLFRTVEHQQQCFFNVAVLLYFHVDKPRTLLSEMGLWKFVPKALGPETPLDEMIAKARGEALCVGRAYPPGGQPARSCRVRMQVGEVDKTLVAVGDRVWDFNGSSEPAPFTEMPIRWSHAYGGEGFGENPVGKGHRPVTGADGQSVHALPNIEDPANLVRERDGTVRPAGYMPVDLTWSPRMARAGTYDDQWLKDSFPGLPPDGRWTIYNLAPEDQWVDGFFRGDESFLLENMHPTRPRIEGRLPGAVARVLVTQRDADGDSVKEIPTRLDTVWFFPDAERCVVIYRGTLGVADDEATDLVDLLAAVEDPAAPKDLAHYQRVRALRMDKEVGAVHALRDADLLPDWVPEHVDDVPDEMAAIKEESLVRKNQYKRALREVERARAKVAAAGLDPDEHGPRLPDPEERPPSIDQLPDFMARKRAEIEKIRAEQKVRDEATTARTRELFVKAGLDYSVVEREMATAQAGPPEYLVDQRIAVMQQIAAKARAEHSPLPDVEGMLANPQFRQGMVDSYLRGVAAYRKNAHMQAPVTRKSEADSAPARAYLEGRLRGGEALALLDLTGLDLAGVQLPGAQIFQTLMEGANLAGANLAGADLREAVLTRADLTGADLSGANLEGANLGGATLCGANLEGANLADAVGAKANFSGAKMARATLRGADLSECRFVGADLRGAELGKLMIARTDLTNLNLAGARMEEIKLLDVALDGADLTGAALRGATLITVSAKGAKFTGATMNNFRAQLGCDFSGSDFRGARCAGSNFRDTPMAGCDFSEALLDDSDFTGCDLRRARFVRADARRARFVRADLTDAELTAADLMYAVLSKATLQGAALRHANLYAADMSRVLTSARTVTDGANLTKVRVHPVRRKP
jgi:uncharacterized protein YjbI with pentapeptide repeats